MSGGYWDYKNHSLASEMFGWNMSVNYGPDGFNQAQMARKMNPMGNKEVSEMLWDMMCLIYSKDYYESSDISEAQYKQDLDYFKKKWLHRTKEDTIEAYKNDLRDYAEELIKEMEDKDE